MRLLRSACTKSSRRGGPVGRYLVDRAMLHRSGPGRTASAPSRSPGSRRARVAPSRARASSLPRRACSAATAITGQPLDHCGPDGRVDGVLEWPPQLAVERDRRAQGGETPRRTHRASPAGGQVAQGRWPRSGCSPWRAPRRRLPLLFGSQRRRSPGRPGRARPDWYTSCALTWTGRPLAYCARGRAGSRSAPAWRSPSLIASCPASCQSPTQRPVIAGLVEEADRCAQPIVRRSSRRVPVDRYSMSSAPSHACQRRSAKPAASVRAVSSSLVRRALAKSPRSARVSVRSTSTVRRSRSSAGRSAAARMSRPSATRASPRITVLPCRRSARRDAARRPTSTARSSTGPSSVRYRYACS